MSKPTPEGFKEIVRAELRARGVTGAGTASITVERNSATLNWIWQGRACRMNLNRHFDRYMDGREFLRALRDDLDREFQP